MTFFSGFVTVFFALAAASNLHDLCTKSFPLTRDPMDRGALGVTILIQLALAAWGFSQ